MLGCLSVLLGAILAFQNHHTLGLGGGVVGAILIVTGGLLRVLGDEHAILERRKPYAYSSGVYGGNRNPGIRRAGIATLVVVLVGVGTFYGAAYLASQTTNTPNTSTSSRSGGITSESSGTRSTTTSFGGSTSSSSFAATVKLASIQLYSGTASNSTIRGTARLYMVLNDTGSSTNLIEVALTGRGIETRIYTCSGPSVCSTFSGSVLKGNSASYFNSNSSAFYISVKISSGQSFACYIYLSNGQKFVQSLVAI